MATVIAMQPLAPHPGPIHSPLSRQLNNHAMLHKPQRTSLQILKSANGQRARKERPCDGCRRRKSKCVLQDSIPCVLCKFHNQECTFVEAALPRKRKAEDPSKKDTSPTKSAKTSNVSPRSSETAQSKASSETAVATLPVKRSARVDDMTILDDTLSLQRHRHCRYIGQTSALDTSLLGLCDFDASHEAHLNCGDVRQVSTTGFFDMTSDSAFPTYDEEIHSVYEVEQIVGPHGPALIDIYFANVHPSFPIIQKQVFLNRHRHGDRQFNAALLAGMYILALRWWFSDPSLAHQPMPDIEALEEVGFRSLSLAMQRPKLSALQAGLLLLQRQHSNAWALTVQLVALAQDLGLHLDCSSWSIPLWERRLRKRLAWALYIQDKWSGLIHGRPSHIQANDWAVQPLVQADFVEDVVAEDQDTLSSDSDHPAEEHSLVFVQMIELTSIMGEVIDTFYTQRAVAEFERAGKGVTGLILKKAKPVQLKLKEWFARLPAEARMDSYTPGQLSSNGYLHLAYFATEISIHRRIVQSLTSRTSDPYMMHICRSAAKTRLISAMDFVNRLKPEHLDSFWYFASATNFALIATFGSLLRATAPGHEESTFYESRLREYRWALAVSAKKADWIESAVHMLDITNNMLSNLPDKPSSGGQSPRSQDSVMQD